MLTFYSSFRMRNEEARNSMSLPSFPRLILYMHYEYRVDINLDVSVNFSPGSLFPATVHIRSLNKYSLIRQLGGSLAQEHFRPWSLFGADGL